MNRLTLRLVCMGYVAIVLAATLRAGAAEAAFTTQKQCVVSNGAVFKNTIVGHPQMYTFACTDQVTQAVVTYAMGSYPQWLPGAEGWVTDTTQKSMKKASAGDYPKDGWVCVLTTGPGSLIAPATSVVTRYQCMY